MVLTRRAAADDPPGRDLLARLAASRTFAYGTLVALQARVMWGFWRFKDLSAGDSSYYFVKASRWAESSTLDPVWSPLFAVLQGSLLRILPDPFAATVALRILLVGALAVLVLAILRSLLPHPVAWLLAAWFAVVPVNFNSLYEVHLFSALPTLLAVVLVGRLPGPSGRAVALGLLLATGLMVRNELLIATVMWGAFCLWRDGRRLLGGGTPGERTGILASYALAVALVLGLWGAVCARSDHDLATLRLQAEGKHTFNVCQIYAFGYSQRHPEWTASPWTDCQDLMERDFGAPAPTMVEALRANPQAMATHFAWNALLVPSALHLQLFGAIPGGPTPDYVRVPIHPLVAVAGVLALVLVVAGGLLLWRDRASGWQPWLRERFDSWALLACLTANSAFVMLVARPRPSYLFNQAVALLAIIGVAAVVVSGRWRATAVALRLVPALAVLLVLFMPPYWDAETPQAFGQRGQPLRRAVERVWPVRELLAGHEHRLLAASFVAELCNYAGGASPCTAVALTEVTGVVPLEPGALLAAVEARGVDWIYVDEQAWDETPWQSLRLQAEAYPTWQRLAPTMEDGERWALFRRREAAAASRVGAPRDRKFLSFRASLARG